MKEVTDPEILKQLEPNSGKEVTDPALINQLEGAKGATAPSSQPPQPGLLERTGKWVGEKAKDVGEFVSDPKKLGRLTFEMAGAGVGGAAGSGATPIAGTIAGGALGYAFGDKLADIVWGERLPPEKAGKPLEQLWQTTKDVGTGLKYEALGKGMDLAGRGVGATWDAARGMKASGLMPWMTGKVEDLAVKQAAKKVAAATSIVPSVEAQVGKNIEAAENVEKNIPGLRFNLGQKTGDPNLLALTRAESQSGSSGAPLSGESVMKQNEAIRDYIKHHIRGGGKVDDFLTEVQAEQNKLAGKTTTAVKDAETEATHVGGREEQEVGANLLEKARRSRTVDAQEAKRLYGKVPEDLKINTTPLWDKVNDLFGSFDALTQRLGATPTGPMGRIREAMKPELVDATGKRITPMADMPPELTMKQIKDFRSQVTSAQRGALVSKDYELAYNLGQLKEGINETLNTAAETGEGAGVQALKDATKFWRDTYVPKFRQGPTGKILGIGRTGEQTVADSSIGGQFFKPGKGAGEAADNFNYVFGKDTEATGLLRDYAAQSLLKDARNPATGELESKRITSWLYRHDTALNKLGLKKEFGSLQNAMKMADEARGTEIAFNKTSLAKSLNVDPDRAINSALMTGTGRKQSIQRLQEMVRLAKQDKTGSAMLGLKAGIGDYFQRQTVLTARDLAGNRLESLAKMDRFMEEFKPALRQSGLYTPSELKAFENVHQAVQIIAKQQQPTPGFVGSPTAQILATMAKMGANGTSIALGHMGVYGASLGIFQGALKKVAGDRVDEALARAVFDPRYAAAISGLAYNLKTIGRGLKPGANLTALEPGLKRAAKIFNQQMITLGLMVTGRPGEINKTTRVSSQGYETPTMGPIASGPPPTFDHLKHESE